MTMDSDLGALFDLCGGKSVSEHADFSGALAAGWASVQEYLDEGDENISESEFKEAFEKTTNMYVMSQYPDIWIIIQTSEDHQKFCIRKIFKACNFQVIFGIVSLSGCFLSSTAWWTKLPYVRDVAMN